MRGITRDTRADKEAMRNAINHTAELFGQRYNPRRLQVIITNQRC
jgi:hypothetical protein